MKLLLLGATGRVGSHILSHALGDGHAVTALVRSPEKLSAAKSDQLQVLSGNVLDRTALQTAMSGADAVVSALSTDGGETLSKGMPLIVEAMQAASVQRIVTIGTAGILQSRVSPELLRYQSSESRRALTRASEEHHQAYLALAGSDREWTIVCPTYLPDGKKTGTYRVEANFLPENGKEISVPDTAAFAYAQLFSRAYVHMRVGIAY